MLCSLGAIISKAIGHMHFSIITNLLVIDMLTMRETQKNCFCVSNCYHKPQTHRAVKMDNIQYSSNSENINF